MVQIYFAGALAPTPFVTMIKPFTSVGA